MNEIQSYIIKNLNYSLRGKKTDIQLNTNINWNELVEECQQHQISSLVYSGIPKKSLKNIDNDILEKWKRETFMSGAYQINHIKQISGVLSIFNTNNIPVIALKGLVVRDLYPKSELRTMGDADILVHEKDLDKVSSILTGIGYVEHSRNAFHIEFCKENSYIEVHWTLANETMFDGIAEFKNELWERAIEVNVGDSTALSMCDEDLLLHLCIHMAKHFINGGFGIRQVCDVMLVVEQRWKFIDWNSFIIKAKRSRIDKFTMSIFAICNKLFEMSIPDELENYKVKEDKYINLIIDAIFSNGVHGHRDKMATRAKSLAYENDRKKVSGLASFRRVYFPSIEKLGDKYDYAKKYKILLPIAWLHRFMNTVFRNDYSVVDKLRLFIQGAGISKKHSELLSWLDL